MILHSNQAFIYNEVQSPNAHVDLLENHTNY